jgi:hypothetical protein
VKKVINLATSFVLGFMMFAAGGAIATEITTPPSEDQVVVENQVVVEDQVVVEVVDEQVVDDSVTPEVPAEEVLEVVETTEPESPQVTNENPVFCWNIGKGDELGGDCFCVEGSVTDMLEVDCLIASGIVPADSYDDYRRYLGLID